MKLFIILIVFIGIILLCSIKQINEYERGILFTCGKFKKILKPGWNIVLPIVNSISKVDIRTKMFLNKMQLLRIMFQLELMP